ncbi:efflux ABC transporter, permease protein [[Clostridium] hylemonae DSM 15053]|uniref:Efflux ABC transporter, permease protein n=1 Tax=[Clostridium] hylemonae DSM 15053 TaxID=553973 RepID=C0C4E8_9FIRM|nr:FtsX-like permease family protein [[Clostridium] hylemonae]EEG72941.1 efflux ABC transporter, permease protein [[Clostridium] hylemonae DSM 15053]QEK16307.1 hypothetical protein LAJLEIBI_00287 [[Clostridium] hylemonae DSM 15053]
MAGKIRLYNRALIYIVRKKSQSIRLFIVFFILFTLVMTGITISNAAGKAADGLRNTLGGYFKLEEDPEYAGKREAITDTLAERIEKLDGIERSNKINTEYLYTPKLTLRAGRFSREGDIKAQMARFLGNSDSSLNEFFIRRSFCLTKGRHIGPGDVEKAVISESLADINELDIGDFIEGVLYTQDNSRVLGNYKWEVIGIFAENTVQESSGLTAECDLRDNFIFVDETSLMNVQTDESEENAGKYREAVFFLEDPARSDQVVKEVFRLDGVNWDSFCIKENNKAYEKAAAPLKKLRLQTEVLLLMIIGISIVLVTLLLFMWMRERLREVGILRSIGISKLSVIGQHMTETLLVVLAALVLTVPATHLLTDYAQKRIADTDVVVEDQKNELRQITDAPADSEETEEYVEITVSVGRKEFWFVVLYGLGLSAAAVGVSSIRIIRMKPRDIMAALE